MRPIYVLGLVGLGGLLLGCANAPRVAIDSDGGVLDGGSVVFDNEPVAQGTQVTVAQSPQDQAEVGDFVARQLRASALTSSQLQNDYALTRNDKLPFDPSTADGLSLIQSMSDLALSDGQLSTLIQAGIVINAGKSFNTFTDGYAQIYADHLPLFVSADSMMDAVHRSYDHILEALEVEAFVPTLVATLSGLTSSLPASAASARIKADLDVYLAVASALLNGTTPTLVAGGDGSLTQTLLNQATTGTGMAKLTLFGSPRTIDFSMFTPRGHYTDSMALEQYFRAMIWLGTIDFRLIETLTDGSQVFNRPQFDAMVALSELFDSTLYANWSTLHAAITALVGQDDSMTLDQVPKLEQALGVSSSAGLANLDDAPIAQAIATGRFGTQRIDSYVLITDPHTSTLPLNSSFLIFGQRFTVDSYVLSNVVYDRVNDPNFPPRFMANTLDAAFAAMGNRDALPLLASELDTYGYAPELATIRGVIDDEPSEYWQSSLYTLWLSSLRALSPSASDVANPTASGLPSVIGTTAWGRRLLNTQLSSWAELRHDNVLYVKPAESTGVMCAFPSAYVEPSVPFWDALLQYATQGSSLLTSLPTSLQTTVAVSQGQQHFSNLESDVTLLRAMAVQQLTGADLTPEQLAFINQAVSIEHICGGGVSANGWYPQLIVLGTPTEYKPTIADIFTDPQDQQVLEIGTGNVFPTVVTVETCMGPRAFVGLSLGYYETTTQNLTRLTDAQWQTMLPTAQPPSWMAQVMAQ